MYNWKNEPLLPSRRLDLVWFKKPHKRKALYTYVFSARFTIK